MQEQQAAAMDAEQHQGPQQRRELYKFNPDELRVLRECNYESFYYRSLPLGTVLGGLAFYGVKSGYFKGSAKWGPLPKVLLGATAGYFIGKMSYQSKCAEKLMTLPNSPLADALRQRKGQSKIGFQEGFTSEPINLNSSLSRYADKEFNQDYLQDMRTEDRSYDPPPSAVGLDDNFRPSMDSFTVSDAPLPPSSPVTTSYDDLRRKNREEYEQKRMEAYKRTDARVTNSGPPVPPGYPQPVPSSQRPRSFDKKNAYGDVWADE